MITNPKEGTMNTLNLDTKIRSMQDDLTLDELTLFMAGPEEWGGADDTAERGALYLDRVMPDWYTKVEILPLDLSSPCACVLGQLFRPMTAQILAADSLQVLDAGGREIGEYSDGFNLGRVLLGMNEHKATTDLPTDRDGDELGIDVFLGFDHYTGARYEDLTDAWSQQVATRQLAAEA